MSLFRKTKEMAVQKEKEFEPQEQKADEAVEFLDPSEIRKQYDRDIDLLMSAKNKEYMESINEDEGAQYR